MLQPVDIVLRLKLMVAPTDGWTVRGLAVTTTIARSDVQRSLTRLGAADLVDPRRRRARLGQTEEFLLHGLRYVFPARLEGETRGIPAAWAADPLTAEIVTAAPLPPVWPHEFGSQRGLALEPLSRFAINAAATDPALGEHLALVDALRAGDARIRGVAGRMLSNRLNGGVAA